MLAVPILFLGLAVVSAGSLLWGSARGEDAGPVAHMRDLASELSANIEDMAAAGLAKTAALAADPRLPRVLEAGDRTGAEALANDLLEHALELDIVAIFRADGVLLAVSTVDHAGAPIPRDRLEQLYLADFSDRGVVQGCLRDLTASPRMEFQTRCDFTPPIFESSGLSVAMSAPVLSGGDASRLGVVSTRLNFDRVTALVRDSSYIRAGNAVYLVSDAGEFFDERINAGRSPRPMPAGQVLSALAGDQPDGDEVLVRRDGVVLLGRRVPVASAIAGGGINVLLRGSEGWLMAETRRARLLAGIVLLVSVGATSLWALYATARSARMRAQVALSGERARLSLILENAGEGVLGVDRGGHVTFANAKAEELLGSGVHGLIGTSLRDLAPSNAGASETAAWKCEDTVIHRPDGASFHGQLSYTPLPDGEGGVATFSDLTRRIETERRLREATRLAGRAEVATSVLHNVGNVLTSVNVAASLLAEKLRGSEVGSLVRAGELIREHRADLPAFLASDERGRHLPGFLVEVSRCLGEEQQTLLQELETVMRGVEHVRQVVSMQQAHAKSPSQVEEVTPAELMESALALQQDGLARHAVVVERRFAPVAPLPLDKHQVLQILLNLLTNAKQAVRDLPPERRTITLTISERDEDGAPHVVLEVADNGVGIAPEDRDRIFGYGFTTRRDGHGFGLHSAANAAKEMGGSLSVHSDGPGRGARFSLVLPVRRDAGVRPDPRRPDSSAGSSRAEDLCTAS